MLQINLRLTSYFVFRSILLGVKGLHWLKKINQIINRPVKASI